MEDYAPRIQNRNLLGENITGYEDRAMCPVCGVTESIEHILTECQAPDQEVIWELVEDLWVKRGTSPWLQITIGDILGCGMITILNKKNKKSAGAARLHRILVSESAHLIWKPRCERRITREDNPEKWHSTQEITRRWRSVIDLRLTMDRVMTHPRYGRKALKAQYVLATWAGLLVTSEIYQ